MSKLAKEAVEDVKSMVDLAIEAAKTEIIESMTPNIKKLLEKKLRGTAGVKEDTDRLRRAKEGYGETEFEEGKNKGEKLSMDKDKEMEVDESLSSFFAPIAEEEELEMEAKEDDMYEAKDDDLDEAKDDDLDEAKDEDLDEEVEISEEALRAVYEASMQTEAKVKSGFGEPTKGGDFGKEKPDSSGGIADVKSGEHDWDEELPPAKQDWTVKEMIERGMAENRALRTKLNKLQETYGKLYKSAVMGAKKLQEVNLFNSKLLHVTRFLNSHGRLTKEQKRIVIERIEKASTVNEVKMVFETIVESFKVAQGLTESTERKPVANMSRARTSGSAKVISESADKAGNSSAWSRIQQLAGLKNIK